MLAALREMTVILVTHDPLQALSLCPAMPWFFDQGRIVEAGPLTDLLDLRLVAPPCAFHDEFSRQTAGRFEEKAAMDGHGRTRTREEWSNPSCLFP